MKSSKHTFTIMYNGVEMVVTGNYSPEEPEIRYNNDMSGSPGYPAEFEVYSVEVNGVELAIILSDRQLDEIEEICLNIDLE